MQPLFQSLMNKRSISTFACAVVILTTAFAFLPCLDNNFVNWDDDLFVIQHENIKTLSAESIKRMFTSTVCYLYVPLTSVSLAVDYQLYRMIPQGYHLTNFLLHLVNTALVFWLILLIGTNIRNAFVVALLFGIHPLHAESVAWISERKDLLYALFFLLACISYCYYALKSNKHFFMLTLLCFLLSLLSKPAAVSFLLIMPLIDYWFSRPLGKRSITEKIPFILGAAGFSILAIVSQHAGNALRGAAKMPLMHRFVIPPYNTVFYLQKLLIPRNLSCFYPFLREANDAVPPAYLINTVVFVVLCVVVVYMSRRFRFMWFGSLFYVLTLLPMLQILAVGSVVSADRFAYLPSIGIFYIASELFFRLCEKLYARKKELILVPTITVGIVIMLMLNATRLQSEVWHNGITLWSNVVRTLPHSYIGYEMRGNAYYYEGMMPQAVQDYTKALSLNPDSAMLYTNRGVALYDMGKREDALRNYNKALSIDPECDGAYFNRGNYYFDCDEFKLAISDYDKALANNPAKEYTYIVNRANAYMCMRDFEQGIRDYSTALSYAPHRIDLYINRADAYRVTGKSDEAVRDYEHILRLDPGNEHAEKYLKEVRDKG